MISYMRTLASVKNHLKLIIFTIVMDELTRVTKDKVLECTVFVKNII